jgi:exodeoxyribonuclease VII large subunit
MYHAQRLLGNDPLLADVWIHGELSSLSQSPAGHLYFSLREGGVQLKCVMFRNAARRLTARLEAGLAVVAHGAIGIYEAQSLFQLCVDLVEPEGVGAAFLEFELLRQRLEEEGLFAVERKRPLPRFPRRIGVATSLAGAVLHDITRVLGRRYPIGELVVAGCAVQGEFAPREIVSALRRLNQYAPGGPPPPGGRAVGPIEVIVLARGGGSPEELAAFNDEAVARAIFASTIPVISAIGHETDFTIADFVADVRAATPSVAAEIVAPDCAALVSLVRDQRRRLAIATTRGLQEQRQRLGELHDRLRWRSPQATLDRGRQRVDELTGRACRALQRLLAEQRARIHGKVLQLEALSPVSTLERGYALCYEASSGRLVLDATTLSPGDAVHVRLKRGGLRGTVQSINAETLPIAGFEGSKNGDGSRPSAV